MTFLHPSILFAGLACIAIPIVIHLLMRRRRKPVPWAAMRFLLEAYQKQRRRLTLEQLLLLALRCLLIALVGGALARPMLGAAGMLTGPGPRTVYLVIDNSLASSVSDADGKMALAEQRAWAEKLLDQLDPARGDRAGLVLVGSPAESIVAPASPDIGGVRAALEAVKPTDGPADWTGAVAELRTALESTRPDEPAPSIVLVSDLRTGSVDLRRPPTKLETGTGASILVRRPAEKAVDNITVLDVEPLRGVLLKSADIAGGAGEPARVTLRRSGPGVSRAGVTEVRVSVETPGAAPAKSGTAVVRWASGQEEANVSATVPADLGSQVGSRVLTARIDADAIAADNVRRRPVRVSEAVEVGVISPPVGLAGTIDRFTPTDWYRLALSPEGDAGLAPAGDIRVTVVESSQAGVRPLSDFDAVIVPYPDSIDEGGWRNIGGFTRAGGVLIVSPPPAETVNVWADPMARALGLEWEVGREPRTLEKPATVAAGRESGSAGALLGLLGGELEELLKPVRVLRILDVNPKDVSTRVELRTSEGHPLLVVGEPSGGRGVVAMLAASLDLSWTDLPVRPLMVPLVQELVRQGAGRAGGAWQGPAGSRVPVPPGTVELRGGAGGGSGPGGGEVVTVASAESATAMREAGVWRALDGRGNEVGLITVNADPEAARVEMQSQAELAGWLNTLAGSAGWRWLDDEEMALASDGKAAGAKAGSGVRLGAGQGGSPISVPLLLGAILVALAELGLARWSSHAQGMTKEPAA